MENASVSSGGKFSSGAQTLYWQWCDSLAVLRLINASGAPWLHELGYITGKYLISSKDWLEESMAWNNMDRSETEGSLRSPSGASMTCVSNISLFSFP